MLAVQPSVLVLDAAALHRGEALPDSQRQALPDAGLLLLNKSEGLDDDPPPGAGPPATGAPAVLDDLGQLPIDRLPGIGARASESGNRSACRMGRLR